jgi:Asp/Glu/hydantoin racemase
MRREGFDDVELPKIDFPTKDGRVYEMIEPPANQTQTTIAASEDALKKIPIMLPLAKKSRSQGKIISCASFTLQKNIHEIFERNRHTWN